jgi:hypothetical protein
MGAGSAGCAWRIAALGGAGAASIEARENQAWNCQPGKISEMANGQYQHRNIVKWRGQPRRLWRCAKATASGSNIAGMLAAKWQYNQWQLSKANENVSANQRINGAAIQQWPI